MEIKKALRRSAFLRVAEDEVNLVKTPFPPQLMSWPTLMPIGISSHFLAFLVS